MYLRFSGTLVRLLGDVAPNGGLADAYLDGVKQLSPVESWNPKLRPLQPVFTEKGLSNGPHELRLIVRGAGNPLSSGAVVSVGQIQTCSATGDAGYGEGEGPRSPQRMVFGFTGRDDVVDSAGHSWKPATEWVVRSGFSMDTVDKAWWTTRRSMYIGNTKDEELYRYGAHG